MFTDFFYGVTSGDPFALLIVAAAVIAAVYFFDPLKRAQHRSELVKVAAETARHRSDLKHYTELAPHLTDAAKARTVDVSTLNAMQFEAFQTTESIRLQDAQVALEAELTRIRADIDVQKAKSLRRDEIDADYREVLKVQNLRKREAILEQELKKTRNEEE